MLNMPKNREKLREKKIKSRKKREKNCLIIIMSKNLRRKKTSKKYRKIKKKN